MSKFIQSLIWQLFSDESGAILSAEAVLVGALGVGGVTLGMSSVASSIQSEFLEAAEAFRSLDQSFSIPAQSCHGAWTAGSQFQQRPVAESLAQLRAEHSERLQALSDQEREKRAAKEKLQEDSNPVPENPSIESNAESIRADVTGASEGSSSSSNSVPDTGMPSLDLPTESKPSVETTEFSPVPSI